MNFSIDCNMISAALSHLVSCVDRKNDKPVLANVLMELNGQELLLTTTNLRSEMSFKLILDDFACTDGRTTVDARKLLQILKVSNGRANLALNGNDLILTCGKARYKLSSLPAQDFPNSGSTVSTEISFVVPSESLEISMNRVSFAMANGDVRAYMNGMQWQSTDKGFRLAATDGFKLGVTAIECKCPDFNLILPRNAVLDLSKLLKSMGDQTKVVIDDTHIQFVGEGITYTSRLIEGRFPDVDRVIPTSTPVSVSFDKDSMTNVIQQCMITADVQSRVNLNFIDGSVKVKAENQSDSGSGEIETSGVSQSLEIGFNGHYILDAISHVSGNDVVLSLSDGNRASMLTCANDDSYRFVVMPLRG